MAGLTDLVFEEQKRKYIQKLARYYPEVYKRERQAMRQPPAKKKPPADNPSGFKENLTLKLYRESLGKNGYKIIAAETYYAVSTIRAFERGTRRTPDRVMDYLRAKGAIEIDNL